MEQETINKIIKYKQALDTGNKVNSKELTETYNEVFGTSLAVTTCSSCVRKRISALYKMYINNKEQNDEENDKLHDNAE